MKRAHLATQLNLKPAQLDALLAQIHAERGGFDLLSDDIPSTLAEALIAQKTASQPQIEAEAAPAEKPKRGRGGKLAKKTTEAVETSMAGAAITSESLDTEFLKVAAIDGSTKGRKFAATRIAAMELADAQTMAQYLEFKGQKLNETIRSSADNFDPLEVVKMATGLTPDSVVASAGKFQADMSLLEEISVAFPWNLS